MKISYECMVQFKPDEICDVHDDKYEISNKMSKYLESRNYGKVYCHLHYPEREFNNNDQWGYCLELKSDVQIEESVILDLVSNITNWRNESIAEKHKEKLRLKKLAKDFLRNLKVPKKREVNFDSLTYANDSAMADIYNLAMTYIDDCKKYLNKKDYASAAHTAKTIELLFKIYNYTYANNMTELYKIYYDEKDYNQMYFPQFLKLKLESIHELHKPGVSL